MDAYKRLVIEYKNIEHTISGYTTNGEAAGLLPSLKTAIEEYDKETILYCLWNMYQWYKDNIQRIYQNEFVCNRADHDRTMDLLAELHRGLQDYDFEKLKAEKESAESCGNTAKSSAAPLIFLSHCSKDKAYGNALEVFITGLGVKKEQLIYTSHPLHKIPLNANIYDYLRQHIDAKIYMIILWSDSYLESPACMNEMGAAWVVQCDYTNIYTPDFDFGNPKYHQCAVDTRKMGAVLNGNEHCKQSMLEMADSIKEMFGLQVDSGEEMYLIDTFAQKVKEIADGKNEV